MNIPLTIDPKPCGLPQHSQETFTAASIRFWHGSMDLSTVWEAHQGGGYQPLSRAYAVDYERVVIGNSAFRPKPSNI